MARILRPWLSCKTVPESLRAFVDSIAAVIGEACKGKSHFQQTTMGLVFAAVVAVSME